MGDGTLEDDRRFALLYCHDNDNDSGEFDENNPTWLHKARTLTFLFCLLLFYMGCFSHYTYIHIYVSCIIPLFVCKLFYFHIGEFSMRIYGT